MENEHLKKLKFLVLDFDGVMTDNRVWVFEDGREAVACNRSDGMGIELLKSQDVEVMVLSKEQNPVVSSRCKKLGIQCVQGLEDKLTLLKSLIVERKLDMSEVAYIGNDINDKECLEAVGCGVIVADSHSSVFASADYVLKCNGGHGAVREFCDMVLLEFNNERNKENG